MQQNVSNPLRRAYTRGLLLPLGIVAVVVVGASIAGAHLISDESDAALRNTLLGGGIGLVVTFVIFMLALWMSQILEERAETSITETPRAPIPLEPLPPYQPMRDEPFITIQIPARTVVVVVVTLTLLIMIYFRVLRGERGNTED